MTKAFSPTLRLDGVTMIEAEGAAATGDSVTGRRVMVEDGVSRGDPVVDVGVNVGGKKVDGIGVDDDEATKIGVKVGGCRIGVYGNVVSLGKITIVIPGLGVEVGPTVIAGAAVVVEVPIIVGIVISVVGTACIDRAPTNKYDIELTIKVRSRSTIPPLGLGRRTFLPSLLAV